MRFRLLCLGSLLPAVIIACSAPDPGDVNPGPPRLKPGTPPVIRPAVDGGPTDGGGGDGSLFSLSNNPQQPAMWRQKL